MLHLRLTDVGGLPGCEIWVVTKYILKVSLLFFFFHATLSYSYMECLEQFPSSLLCYM